MDFNLPLVNAHTHAAMLPFRGKAEDLSLNKWLNDVIWPLEKKHVSENFVYEQTKLAITEMRKNGIHLFNDMYFFEDMVGRVAEELKMYVTIGEGILDFPTPSFKCPEEIFKHTEKLIKKYKDSKYVKIAVAPHSIYIVSKENLLLAKKLADKYGLRYHIHVSETKEEFDNCLQEHGVTPIKYLGSLGVLDEISILAHCVWVTDEDIDIISASKAKVIHCPLSNLKLGSGIAPINKMITKGITVALGTDGAASSNRLDIWEAGKIAALLQKGVNNDSTILPVKTIIRMMTVNGLIALGVNEIEGVSIERLNEIIDQADDYNFLYALNSDQVKFTFNMSDAQ